MKTLVMTVPHSGTHFLIRFLVGVLGLDGRDLGNKREGFISKKSAGDFCHIHPNKKFLESCEGLDFQDVFDAAIITLRHPYNSTRTGRHIGDRIELIKDYWETLSSEKDKYAKVLFLTIDGDKSDRLPQLMAIAEHFGKAHLEVAIREYAENWTPVNQSLDDSDKSAMGFAVEVYDKWQS